MEVQCNMSDNSVSNAKLSGVQFLKYLFFSASAGLIQFGSFTLLVYLLPSDIGTITFITEMPLSTFLSTTIALFLSIIWNFTFNRKFTFKSSANVGKTMGLAFLFYVPFYPFQTWYVNAVAVAINPTAEWAQLIAEATVMIINFVGEFLWQKFVVYRGTENTAKNTAPKDETSETAHNK